jgi:acetyl esterase/lipase
LLPRRYSLLLRPAPNLIQLKNLVYATHAESGSPLKADLWLPPPGVPSTGLAVLYLFGGAWHYMNKDLWTGHVLRHIANQGHVVMNASYTLAHEADVPSMVSEARRAIAWLKEHAATYGVDPERIVLMGCSSGAHLALLTAYTSDQQAFPAVQADVSVRGVISDSGFADLAHAHTHFQQLFGRILRRDLLAERWFLALAGWLFRRLGLLPDHGQIVVPAELVSSLMGGTPKEKPEAYHLASPVTHVGPHCPPTLLLQGANDYCGIRSDVQRLDRALRAAGVPSVYIEFAEADHSFLTVTAGALRWAPGIQAALYDIDRFLALMV